MNGLCVCVAQRGGEQGYERVSLTGDRPRWWSRKTLSKHPLTGTPKSQLPAEQPSAKKLEPTRKKSTIKEAEGTAARRVGGAEL